jgi:hypothetical protein
MSYESQNRYMPRRSAAADGSASRRLPEADALEQNVSLLQRLRVDLAAGK